MGQLVLDERYEDIILQALPAEYERVRTSSYEERDFHLEDTRCIGHFPKVYLIGPMTGSPNHEASTCGAATCGRCSWALRWAARSAWLSIDVVKKRKTLKCYRVFKTNFAGCISKKNQNAPRPSKHPSVRGGNMSTRLDGIKDCKYKTSSWFLKGSPMEITLGQQYNVREKPTVILYTYINRHAGTPEKQ